MKLDQRLLPGYYTLLGGRHELLDRQKPLHQVASTFVCLPRPAGRKPDCSGHSKAAIFIVNKTKFSERILAHRHIQMFTCSNHFLVFLKSFYDRIEINNSQWD